MSGGPISVRFGAYLPHWTREGGTYAVTFRLADSLPSEVLERFKGEREEVARRAEAAGRPLTEHEIQRLAYLHSERVEAYLNAGHGACWLREPRLAELVRGALLHFDAERYELLAWCIMPNHVHAVLTPRVPHGLSGIMHSWKGFTSVRANTLLGRVGRFWQHESYDHLIRDEDDLVNQIRYVLANPGKAGLRGWAWVGVCAALRV